MVSPDTIDHVAFTNIHYTARNKKRFYARYDDYFKRAVKQGPWADGFRKARFQANRALRGNPSVYTRYNRLKYSHEDEKTLRELGFDPARFHRTDHHLCHAAAAYYGLARDLKEEYLVFTLDGGGDGTTSAIYKGCQGNLEKLTASTCFSIGNLYSDITYYLGFTPHEHEYKLMGLAPYVRGSHYYQATVDYFRIFWSQARRHAILQPYPPGPHALLPQAGACS